jgi:hypothetical protein
VTVARSCVSAAALSGSVKSTDLVEGSGMNGCVRQRIAGDAGMQPHEFVEDYQPVQLSSLLQGLYHPLRSQKI